MKTGFDSTMYRIDPSVTYMTIGIVPGKTAKALLKQACKHCQGWLIRGDVDFRFVEQCPSLRSTQTGRLTMCVISLSKGRETEIHTLSH